MRTPYLAVVTALLPAPAFAQAATPAASVDLTGIATSVIAGVFGILGIVVPYVINARMKDKQAADVLSDAVRNSLGAIQQTSTAAVAAAKPSVQIPGVAASLAPGVQYVLDHAGPEMARLGVTQASVAEKVEAQIGLANIASPDVPTSPVITGRLTP